MPYRLGTNELALVELMKIQSVFKEWIKGMNLSQLLDLYVESSKLMHVCREIAMSQKYDRELYEDEQGYFELSEMVEDRIKLVKHRIKVMGGTVPTVPTVPEASQGSFGGKRSTAATPAKKAAVSAKKAAPARKRSPPAKK